MGIPPDSGFSRNALEEKGENWWIESTSEKIQKAAKSLMDKEESVRWHATRGKNPIQFTMLPHLLNIIRQNFVVFEPFVSDIDWAASIFEIVERSRNVIMHSGELSKRDVARLGTAFRDWNSQVAT